jgi:hypothetical protein
MSSSAINNDIAVAACFSSFLAAIGDLIYYYYPFYSRIEFDKIMYKI